MPESAEFPEDKTKLQLYIRFGLSNSAFDWDNGIKPFQDILQKKYNFNDRYIYLGIVEKMVVPRGQEYIYFRVTHLTDQDKITRSIKEIFDD